MQTRLGSFTKTPKPVKCRPGAGLRSPRGLCLTVQACPCLS